MTTTTRLTMAATPSDKGDSYSRGPRDVPLLRETIGENLRRIVERFRRARGARRPPPGLPGDVRASCGGRSTAAARALMARGVGKGDRVGIWAPNRYEWVVTQFATARVGAILVTINPAYKTAELRVRARQGRREPARDGPRLPRHRLRRDARRGPRQLPAAARDDRARGRLGGASSPTARRVSDAELAEREATLQPRRRDQHPVHVGHDGRSRRARRSPTTTSSTTPTSRAARCATTSATASACRCRSTTRSGW